MAVRNVVLTRVIDGARERTARGRLFGRVTTISTARITTNTYFRR